jgi:alkaline phosphatase D
VTFRHGVASGDPLPDSVVLWTRSSGATEVDWVVARDPDLRDVVAGGTAATGPDVDHTVKVDPGGLEPATTYWYRFTVGAQQSPTGRTRTAPAAAAPVANLRLGLVSCASYAAGLFHAYRNLARRDVDVVVHVGDYLYENGRHSGNGPRQHPPDRAVNLEGYRTRHALYKTDPDLQALHSRHPMVAVWDDHELAGGAWSGGAHEHSLRRHGPWSDRKAAAVRAYWEWMPLRPPEREVPERVYRMLRWGDLADLALLDTRLIGRDEPVGRGKGVVVKVSDTGRSILGPAQRSWLETEMAASTARWRVLASQVVLAPIPLAAGRLLNPGQWDGYPDERDWLYRLLAAARGPLPGGRLPGANVAVLSGDIHSSWANELPVGAEFVGPSVSSPAFADVLVPGGRLGAALSERVFRWQNRHVRMVDLRHHGYVVADVTPERIQADWWHLDTVTAASPVESFAGGWQLLWGRPGLTPVDIPAGPR